MSTPARIRTWDKRDTVLAGDGDDSNEEGDEEDLAPVVGSSKQVELGGSSKQNEPDVRAKDAATDMGE